MSRRAPGGTRVGLVLIVGALVVVLVMIVIAIVRIGAL